MSTEARTEEGLQRAWQAVQAQVRPFTWPFLPLASDAQVRKAVKGRAGKKLGTFSFCHFLRSTTQAKHARRYIRAFLACDFTHPLAQDSTGRLWSALCTTREWLVAVLDDCRFTHHPSLRNQFCTQGTCALTMQRCHDLDALWRLVRDQWANEVLKRPVRPSSVLGNAFIAQALVPWVHRVAPCFPQGLGLYRRWNQSEWVEVEVTTVLDPEKWEWHERKPYWNLTDPQAPAHKGFARLQISLTAPEGLRFSVWTRPSGSHREFHHDIDLSKQLHHQNGPLSWPKPPTDVLSPSWETLQTEHRASWSRFLNWPFPLSWNGLFLGRAANRRYTPGSLLNYVSRVLKTEDAWASSWAGAQGFRDWVCRARKAQVPQRWPWMWRAFLLGTLRALRPWMPCAGGQGRLVLLLSDLLSEAHQRRSTDIDGRNSCQAQAWAAAEQLWCLVPERLVSSVWDTFVRLEATLHKDKYLRPWLRHNWPRWAKALRPWFAGSYAKLPFVDGRVVLLAASGPCVVKVIAEDQPFTEWKEVCLATEVELELYATPAVNAHGCVQPGWKHLVEPGCRCVLERGCVGWPFVPYIPRIKAFVVMNETTDRWCAGELRVRLDRC